MPCPGRERWDYHRGHAVIVRGSISEKDPALSLWHKKYGHSIKKERIEKERVSRERKQIGKTLKSNEIFKRRMS